MGSCRLTTNSLSPERPGLPSWLARRPHYHRAAWLWWRGAARLWFLALAGVLAAAALGSLLAQWGWLAAVARHPAALASVSLLCFMSAGVHRRQRLARPVERSWVASLPSAASAAERIVLVPLLWCLMLTAVLCLGALLQGLGSAAFAIAAAVLGGGWGGAVSALVLPQRALAGAQAHRPTVWLNRPLADTRASLLPLGHWPDGLKQTWARPKVLARGSFMILMGLPMTQSQGGFARMALGSVAVWFVGHHLVSLLLALLATAFPAARWLAPTPLSGWRFVVFLGYRIWFKEAVAALLIVCGAMALDSRLPTSTAALLVLAWAGACVALGAAACYLAQLKGVLISPLHRWMR